MLLLCCYACAHALARKSIMIFLIYTKRALISAAVLRLITSALFFSARLRARIIRLPFSSARLRL